MDKEEEIKAECGICGDEYTVFFPLADSGLCPGCRNDN